MADSAPGSATRTAGRNRLMNERIGMALVRQRSSVQTYSAPILFGKKRPRFLIVFHAVGRVALAAIRVGANAGRRLLQVRHHDHAVDLAAPERLQERVVMF